MRVMNIKGNESTLKKVGRRTVGMMLLSLMFVLCGCTKQEHVNIDKGMKLIEQLDYAGALESFEAAIVYEEDEQLLYRGMGLAYMGMSEYAQAAEYFLQSISYAQGNVTDLEFDTNYYLAASYYKQGLYEEAEEIYSAILALRDKDVDAYFLRACTLLKENYYEAAIVDFEKAFSLEPDNLELVTDAYVEMQAAGFGAEGQAYLQKFMSEKEKKLTDSQKGTLYYYLEDYANARIYLDGALNQGDAEVSLMLGKTYEKLGDMNYASVVYQTYLEGNAPSAAIYNSLGSCLMTQEKYEEALAAFTDGIEMGDTAYLQSLKYNQIIAYEYLGRFSDAKSAMEIYLTSYPDDAKAKREYEFLKTR